MKVDGRRDDPRLVNLKRWFTEGYVLFSLERLCKNRCTLSFPRAPSGDPFYFEGWISDRGR